MSEDSSTHTSLIQLNDEDTELDRSVRGLELFLTLFGFCQFSVITTLLAWLAFAFLGVIVPVLAVFYSVCSDCPKFQIRYFEFQILISQAIVAAVSLLCISHNIRKYGVRKLLFVDRYHGHTVQFRKQYIEKIHTFYRKVGVWLAVCFVLKTAREVTRLIYLHRDSWQQSAIVMVVSLVCWTYLTVLFLSGAALLHLVGNLQLIHFENYGKLLERDLDVSEYIEEHSRLTYYLSKISHRFRIFALLEFLIVTASQIAALLQTTGNQGIINFINAGDFAVMSIVQLVGMILFLSAAAKISHRAQGLGSIVSKWHAVTTCNSSDSSSHSGGNLEAAAKPVGISINYSESDLECSEFNMPISTNTLLASSNSSYHKRQAFVNYVQSNSGGFTVFGWMVDRMLINTIFFIELSLVFFVLGKTITVTTR